ncbi:unnamed protein product [Closterium sp. Naga37s-1]|nr:unnamed protein product [Closterium sp. Naga37s-1]
MPPKARAAKAAKLAKMVPAAAAVTLATPTAGPSSKPISASAVPSKSARTLFAEDDTESLTLSAKLAAIRIEQAAGGKQDNGKGKDADFKDAVSDAEEDHSAEEEEGVESGAARRTCFLDDDDDGLMAHDPMECFEEKAKEELAAKLRFPLTLLIPSDRLQECVDGKYIFLDWLYLEDPSYTRRKITDPLVIEVLFLGVAAEISPEMLHEALAVSPLKICKRPAFKSGFCFHRVVHPVSGLDTDRRHRGGLAKQGAATRVLKANLSLRVLRKEYGI